MLKIDNLYYWHNVEHSLLNGIDLTLQKGELLTIFLVQMVVVNQRY